MLDGLCGHWLEKIFYVTEVTFPKHIFKARAETTPNEVSKLSPHDGNPLLLKYELYTIPRQHPW